MQKKVATGGILHLFWIMKYDMMQNIYCGLVEGIFLQTQVHFQMLKFQILEALLPDVLK